MESAIGAFSEILIIRLKPGCDVLAGIEDACRQYDLKNGVILSGLGGWQRASYFEPTAFPNGRRLWNSCGKRGSVLSDLCLRPDLS